MTEEVWEIAANIDDMTGEDLGAAAEHIFKCGALDVWFEPIQMKKFRPGVKLSLLAKCGDETRLAYEVLQNTSAIGVRMAKKTRIILPRTAEAMDTSLGRVRVKKSCMPNGETRVKPEFDDIHAIAEDCSMPIAEVRRIVAQEIKQEKRI